MDGLSSALRDPICRESWQQVSRLRQGSTKRHYIDVILTVFAINLLMY